ncbi:hypothetical protein HY17_10440 [Hyphomonas sp. CY54-11-8]|nr:hypothetical protein HY17_10440 [Hyphomonas sp. CY54-11-8]
MLQRFASETAYHPLVPDGSKFKGPANFAGVLTNWFESYRYCNCKIRPSGQDPIT